MYTSASLFFIQIVISIFNSHLAVLYSIALCYSVQGRILGSSTTNFVHDSTIGVKSSWSRHLIHGINIFSFSISLFLIFLTIPLFDIG
ncbi:dubious [Schizosaccharomyces pombe]|uniref:Uncharacterized protein C19D5.10c n=1 Tax=Schizosaccharomyces pombe (strain 972 / ATCC 24843) TaxID=284812 RepID=YFSA_SCHPO|nr:uncharacterized protein SPAC19D5.10c [Schizosaccharomyces pombe]Q65ZA5.1 RecName: Full=Uncharacterized protein C19D5.10c [Schizosaccharomyces pombe 972h-]CAH25547.1 dubious [Schizosaccharomyces pombe]|eukprot:NP_001018294.1 uncharacterized protein SPAC19D5.10c [Schizosaccharomyces pombe]